MLTRKRLRRKQRNVENRTKQLHTCKFDVEISPSTFGASLFGKYLYTEIILLIFKHLDFKTKCKVAQVCRDFRRILYSSRDFWSSLDLSGREPRKPIFSVDDRISSLTKNAYHFTSVLTNVNLSYSSATSGAAICQLCSSCLLLTSLDVSYCHNLDRYSLAWLVMARNLKKLNLKGCIQMDDFAIGFLPKTARGLTHLNISSLPNVTHHCLKDIILLMDLEKLEMSDSLNIDDWKPLVFYSPGMNPRLRILSLPGNEEVTDFELEKLATRYSQLESVTMFVGDSSDFTGISLLHLVQKCHHLKRIDLAISNPHALAQCLPALQRLSSVALDICYGVFSDDIIRGIALNAQNLTSLCFYSNPDENVVYHITDETLELFTEKCPGLRRLQIFAEKLSPLALKRLGDFKELTQLDMTGPKLCNQSMKYLATKLKTLKQLVILMPEKVHESASLNHFFNGLDQLEHIVLFLDVFGDHDLDLLGSCCPKLGQIELNTHFNFPSTLNGIAQHCSDLRSLKLAQEKPPPTKVRSYKTLEQPLISLFNQCKKIERLAFSGALISPAALQHLTSLPQLYTLQLDNCTSIQFKNFDPLVSQIPRLTHIFVCDSWVDMTDMDIFRYHEMGIKVSDSEDLVTMLW